MRGDALVIQGMRVDLFKSLVSTGLAALLESCRLVLSHRRRFWNESKGLGALKLLLRLSISWTPSKIKWRYF